MVLVGLLRGSARPLASALNNTVVGDEGRNKVAPTSEAVELLGSFVRLVRSLPLLEPACEVLDEALGFVQAASPCAVAHSESRKLVY